jgi:squalene synthase HpnC
MKPADEALIERAWSALPASYRIPEVAPSPDEARRYCRDLAESHYENFHVASWFLPKALRPHFHAIYAYCRISDDLADEVGDPALATALLDLWRGELDACYEGRARHPVFVALAETIRACSIPKEPFADLLQAFLQDQVVTRYSSRPELLGYCRNSANPVGRIVLYACGEASAERFRLSDATCSALQLANFWQDVPGDYARGRIYLPQDEMSRFGVTEQMIAAGAATPEFRALLRHEVAYARGLFADGLGLVAEVGGRLALDLELFSLGGLEILRAIERQDFDVFRARPALSKATKLKLAGRAAAGRCRALLGLGGITKGKAA